METERGCTSLHLQSQVCLSGELCYVCHAPCPGTNGTRCILWHATDILLPACLTDFNPRFRCRPGTLRYC